MASGLPAPFCPLRTMSGIPCPLCGSTRALLAFAALDPLAAFRWNPLTALACAGIVATFLVWLAGRWLRRDWLAHAQARSGRLPVWALLGAALVANWIYLCLTLSR